MVQISDLQAYTFGRSRAGFDRKYVTDESGKKTEVILPIEEFEELLEDMEDLAVLLERRDEPTIPFDEVIAKLKQHGLLPDCIMKR